MSQPHKETWWAVLSFCFSLRIDHTPSGEYVVPRLFANRRCASEFIKTAYGSSTKAHVVRVDIIERVAKPRRIGTEIVSDLKELVHKAKRGEVDITGGMDSVEYVRRLRAPKKKARKR